MQTLNDLEAMTLAIRTYHAAIAECERAGLNARAVARAAAAECELAREQQCNADLRRQIAVYEAAAPRRRLRVVGGEA